MYKIKASAWSDLTLNLQDKKKKNQSPHVQANGIIINQIRDFK